MMIIQLDKLLINRLLLSPLSLASLFRTYLGYLALAALYRLGQLLQLCADFAQGDCRLQVSIASLQLIEFR